MNSEFVYGVQPVLQVLKAARRQPLRLYHHRAHETPEVREIFKRAMEISLKTEAVDASRLQKLCPAITHQGIVLETRPYSYFPFESFLDSFQKKKTSGLILLLDQVQDPHNLGAILRTAHGAGVDAVVLPERGSAEVNATVLKTSAGIAEWMNVIQVKNLARAIDDLKKIPFWIYGTEAGDHPAYFKQDLRGNTAIVMGGEGTGLRKLIREKCDFLLSIPMSENTSSLNVSVATGVLLFEVVRQRVLGNS